MSEYAVDTLSQWQAHLRVASSITLKFRWNSCRGTLALETDLFLITMVAEFHIDDDFFLDTIR